MRAAVLREIPGQVGVEEVLLADPKEHEVRVRVKASGLCHSDLHYLKGDRRGPLPVILGHEVAGVVEQVGSQVRYLQPGDHVIASPSVFCGHCEQCLTGHMSICRSTEVQRDPADGPRLRTPDGETINQFANLSGFAEEILVHEHALTKIAPDVPLEKVAIIGCAVTTGLGAVFNTAKVRPGASVAVIGAGGIGLNVIQGARIAGARQIIAIDLNPAKLELATRLGATDTVDPRSTDAVEAVQELTGGGVDYSFEAIGLKQTAEQLVPMLTRGGLATVVGVLPTGTRLEIDGQAFLEEKRIGGTIMGSNRSRVDLPLFVDYYLQGRLDLDSLISRQIGIDEINEGYAALDRGETARSVIVFPD